VDSEFSIAKIIEDHQEEESGGGRSRDAGQ